MLVARDAGAAGVVFISQIEDEGLFPFEYIPRYDNVGIPIIHLSNTTADRLLKTYNSETIQKMNNSQTSIAFEMDGTFIEAGVDITPVSPEQPILLVSYEVATENTEMNILLLELILIILHGGEGLVLENQVRNYYIRSGR